MRKTYGPAILAGLFFALTCFYAERSSECTRLLALPPGVSPRLLQCRLSSSQSRNRYAERTARYVVQPHLLAESDRFRITTMLAADSALKSLFGPAALL